MRSMIGEPRVVAAGRGASWWGEGWHIFAARIGMWIGIMIVYFVIALVISAVPYVGSIGHSLLTPVFMGGLMLACQAVERNESLRIGHLFEGFQGAHFVPLMIIGAVNIAVWIVIFLFGLAGIWGGFAMTSMSAMTDPSEMLRQSLGSISGVAVVGVIVIVTMLVIVAMLNWFAPALVVFRGVSALEAMKLSFLACLRNWVPFLIYGLIAIGIGIVGVIVVVVILAFVGVGAIAGGTTGGIMAFIGAMLLLFVVIVAMALIVGPIVIGSVYSSYKDTLDAEDPALGNPAYQ